MSRASELRPGMTLDCENGTARRIAFVAGDTAGHVMLTLAIAEAYARLVPHVDALFLAAPGGPAEQIISHAGHRLETVPASALMRVGTLGRAAAVARLAPGVVRARSAIRRHGSQIVIGSGGYASGAALLAAHVAGIPTAIVEPNAVPGLANRLLRRLTHRAYCTFPEAAAAFPPSCRVITGTPVRESLVRRLAAAPSRPAADRVRLLVTGGTRGDAFLADRIPPLVRALQARGVPVMVRHQAGTAAGADLAARYADAGVAATVHTFVDDMASLYTWADVAVARAGAGTIAELALAGLPALLVPLADAAADHQAANARACAATGAAVWEHERTWRDDEVAGRLVAMVAPECLAAMSRAARAQARPDAAARIVSDCEALLTETARVRGRAWRA